MEWESKKQVNMSESTTSTIKGRMPVLFDLDSWLGENTYY